jgi:membrane fusion protein, adhesin transport system
MKNRKFNLMKHFDSNKEDNDFKNLTSYRLVQTPKIAQSIAVIFSYIFIGLVVMLFVTPWQQTSYGIGRVVAYGPLDRQQYIDSPLKGRVVHWFVNEGSRVKKGDPIVEISDLDPEYLSRLTEIKSATESRLEATSMQSQSYKSKIKSISDYVRNSIQAEESKVEMSKQKILAARNKVEASKAEYETAEKNLSRTRQLFAKGLVSKRNLELAELAYTKSSTEYDQSNALLRIAQNDLEASQASLRKIRSEGEAKFEGAKADFSYSLSGIAKTQEDLRKVESDVARQKTQKVTAPRDGVIMRILAKQMTQQLKEGVPLAILIPDSEERAVELYMDGNDIPLMVENQEVRLQFQGWPALQLSGYPQVAVGTFGGIVKLVDVSDNGTGKFRILVVPDSDISWPSTRYLRQGVRAKGWVLLNNVSLAYEIWRRFNDFPPMIPMDEPPIVEELSTDKKKEKK